MGAFARNGLSNWITKTSLMASNTPQKVDITMHCALKKTITPKFQWIGFSTFCKLAYYTYICVSKIFEFKGEVFFWDLWLQKDGAD